MLMGGSRVRLSTIKTTILALGDVMIFASTEAYKTRDVATFNLSDVNLQTDIEHMMIILKGRLTELIGLVEQKMAHKVISEYSESAVWPAEECTFWRHWILKLMPMTNLRQTRQSMTTK